MGVCVHVCVCLFVFVAEDDTQLGEDESSTAVGLVIGIIVGVIVFLVFLAVVGVCCYRKKKEEYMARGHAFDQKEEFANGAMSPSYSYGVDNAVQEGTFPYRNERYDDDEDDRNGSPRMKQKLIPTQSDFEYRDHSGSDTDSKDPYIMRKFDRSPTKSAAFRYEDEASDRFPDRRDGRVVQRQEDDRIARTEGNQQKQSQPSRSPALNTEHTSSRLQAEDDSPRRRQRRDRNDSDDDRKSDDSVTDVGKTSAVTNLDSSCRPQPAQRTVGKLPVVAPVSKSPKSPPRLDTDIKQSHRLSSSSSGTGQSENIDENRGRISLNPGGISPSLSSKEKPDTRHTLRPDRGKNKKTPEKRKQSPNSRKQDVPNSDSKPPKSDSGKSKPSKADKMNGKAGTPKTNAEYEGRFKKADSARKSKSKTPRLGRSRSTGHDLDDADSVGRGSVSNGYRAVPSVTADDYEDSDVESNYNRKCQNRQYKKALFDHKCEGPTDTVENIIVYR